MKDENAEVFYDWFCWFLKKVWYHSQSLVLEVSNHDFKTDLALLWSISRKFDGDTERLAILCMFMIKIWKI